MIKKEFRDIMMSTIYCFTGSMIIPVMKLLKLAYLETVSFLFIFQGLLPMVIIALAISFGGSMFDRDRKENAMEYLFTFPLNKSQIMVNKLIPRLAVLLPVMIGFELFSWLTPQSLPLIGNIMVVADPLFLPVIVVFFFVAMMCHGLFEQKNTTAVVSVLTFYSIVFISLGVRTLLIKRLSLSLQPRYLDGISFSIAAFILIAIILIAFIPAFKRADLKYVDLKGTVYAVKILIPMSLLMIGGILALIFM